MRHLFFIDPIEKLNIKKDSSLYLALSAKNRGESVYFLFEKDLAISNLEFQKMTVYEFTGTWLDDGPYLKSLQLTENKELVLTQTDIIHMRLDPPFDSRYLRNLWLLDFLKQKVDLKVVNCPRGIMNFHEKLSAYLLKDSIPSFVGIDVEKAVQFMNQRTETEFVLKPLDLFGGQGVEKVARAQLKDRFISKLNEIKAPIIVQPYQKSVEEGELRVIAFKGKILGSILKKPKSGDFISNIAAGGSFVEAHLNEHLKNKIESLSDDLFNQGLDLIAYDVLGETITEINLTCPGLLVEVAKATKLNLAQMILDSYLKS